MRNGSAAIVPLFLAVMLLFWFIMFMGGSSDTLHKVTNLTHLQNLQDKILQGAIDKRYDLVTSNPDIYSEVDGNTSALDAKIAQDVSNIMVQNNIDVATSDLLTGTGTAWSTGTSTTGTSGTTETSDTTMSNDRNTKDQRMN